MPSIIRVGLIAARIGRRKSLLRLALGRQTNVHCSRRDCGGAMDRSLTEHLHVYKDSSTGVAGGNVDRMSFRWMLVASADCFRGASPRQDDGGDSRR